MPGQVRVEIRFFAGLDELVEPRRRDRASTVVVAAGTTVKDLLESLGVPHTEVDVILLNGRSVDFARRLTDGDRVGVYPDSRAFGTEPVIRLRPATTGRPRFVLDVHLGRLARGLRLLGFDTLWSNDASDEELVAISEREGRFLLTRDRGLLKRRAVTHGYLVRAISWRDQVVEVMQRFALFGSEHPFSRCLHCNGTLRRVDRSEVEHLLLPRTREEYEHFWQCSCCNRVYWRGSHFERLSAVVSDLRRHGRDFSVHEDEAPEVESEE